MIYDYTTLFLNAIEIHCMVFAGCDQSHAQTKGGAMNWAQD